MRFSGLIFFAAAHQGPCAGPDCNECIHVCFISHFVFFLCCLRFLLSFCCKLSFITNSIILINVIIQILIQTVFFFNLGWLNLMSY